MVGLRSKRAFGRATTLLGENGRRVRRGRGAARGTKDACNLSLWLIGEPFDRASSLDAAQKEQAKSGGVLLSVGSVLRCGGDGCCARRAGRGGKGTNWSRNQEDDGMMG